MAETIRASLLAQMLIARRLIQDAPTHKLGDLVRFKNIDNSPVLSTEHLADSEMTARLWLLMIDELQSDHGIPTAELSTDAKNI